MNQFAEVALPLGIDKTFTYLIPPDLRSLATIGCRAIVPIGRRYATGVIVETPSSSNIKGLKPIKDIIDSSPAVSPELMKLCMWVAGYYFAPLGEVLKSAIPHGFVSSKRMVRACLSGLDLQNAITQLEAGSRQRARLLRLLENHGPMVSSELQRRSGIKSINSYLNEMELGDWDVWPG